MITDEAIAPGTKVYHKEYGPGIVDKIVVDKIYVSFDRGPRIFPYPEAMLNGYLTAYKVNLEPAERTTPPRPTEQIFYTCRFS